MRGITVHRGYPQHILHQVGGASDSAGYPSGTFARFHAEQNYAFVHILTISINGPGGRGQSQLNDTAMGRLVRDLGRLHYLLCIISNERYNHSLLILSGGGETRATGKNNRSLNIHFQFSCHLIRKTRCKSVYPVIRYLYIRLVGYSDIRLFGHPQM